MSTTTSSDSRGRIWLSALAGPGTAVEDTSTVLAADAPLGGEAARFIAVVPDPANRFPRARQGEVGLEEGWGLAAAIREIIEADRDGARRPIVALVDVTSQAYGRQEEMLGIHLACAAAADAYAAARLAGHPVVALLVGKAMSGAFLAHGYQANRILALADDGVLVHAMGREAAARVTRRTVAELDRLGEQVPPMAYGIRAYAGLGLLHRLIEGVGADAPATADVERVRAELAAAVADIRSSGQRDLSSRLTSAAALQGRPASIEVRRRLAEQWDAA
ncbi:biotin-independent malonate decarboxylase subunit gamma [Inquilinus limosus]|uniref:Biotin-independent malonate decarboxylase subunit gamma n=1 Tax=Inquilinus limosus TaxID=171674 RepID=A0A211ZE57_9PROT|nr:biotin-independent malonate decarboxylase subunit gamma [Inquilinus limosus]OWJ63541.1 biotin-independent malonate decarboxylase subunit gamma [Inquilinus limosus]